MQISTIAYPIERQGIHHENAIREEDLYLHRDSKIYSPDFVALPDSRYGSGAVAQSAP